MKEIWKDIAGYDGLYQVSNLGRVKSLPRYRNAIHPYITRERILSPRKTKNGYVKVLLSGDTHRQYLIHRLVAEAFIPNPNNYGEINHKDEDKSNNAVNNLEWCTRSYNIRYGSWRDKLIARFGRPVLQYTLDGSFVNEFRSMGEAMAKTGINSGSICRCCKGIIKRTGNYIWKYKEM